MANLRSGKHHVQICTNVACMLKGGYEILERAKKRLEVGHKETTQDGVFSLWPTSDRAGTTCKSAPTSRACSRVATKSSSAPRSAWRLAIRKPRRTACFPYGQPPIGQAPRANLHQRRVHAQGWLRNPRARQEAPGGWP